MGIGDPCRAVRQDLTMPNQGDGHAAGMVPAEQAAPVRRWLIGFFQKRVRNSTDVEDLVQDVFARIVARDSSEQIEHLAGYIAKTAASVLNDQARRRSARRSDLHISFDAELHGDEDFDPERVLSGKEELHAATAALLSLPERTRTVFVLRRLEGYRFRDIAERLGISVSAVEKHMVRAISHLAAAREARCDP
jgi:RNA polymerase sigma factor (sigma-70 family)